MIALVIGKIWPEPTSSAAGTRTLDILRALEGWELHFACAAQKNEYSADLESLLGITTHQIELNSSRFDRWISTLRPAVVIFDRYMTEEQFGWRVSRTCPEALRVIDTSDLHFLREARQRSISRNEKVHLYNEVSIREIAAIFRSDLSLIISEYEYNLLVSNFSINCTSIAYWPFLLPEPERNQPDFDSRSDFVMIGSFLHEPNWDAVHWCNETIWPRIREALPNAELNVYGSYPPPKAYNLNNPPSGFNVRGRAADSITTLKRHRVNLAPLRFGAGLKGKLADAFIAGTPTVTTPIGVEGMQGDLDWGSLISEDPDAIAKEAIEIYSNRERWKHAQECGFTIAAKRFSSRTWLGKLPKIIEESRKQIKNRRETNFIGRMLNHHHHRSTEFMSRWIEEKNKHLGSSES